MSHGTSQQVVSIKHLAPRRATKRPSVGSFPFYWAFLNSIKRPADTFVNSFVPFLQFQPTLEHWLAEIAIPEIRQALLNSTIIAVGAATLSVLIGTPAAYALARFRFYRPSNRFLTTWFLSQRILPPVLFVIPFFLIARELRLLDSVFSLILLNATFTLPFSIIILSQMFRELPYELEEVAYVDGASTFQAFARVALPWYYLGLSLLGLSAWPLAGMSSSLPSH